MKTRPIRENLLSSTDSDGKLLANKCPRCEQVYYPKQATFCLNCLHDKLNEIMLTGRGKLHTFARSEVAAEFLQPPYVCGVIELDEGIKVFAPMHPDHIDDELSIDMPVQILVGEVWRTDEESVIAYHFKPVL